MCNNPSSQLKGENITLSDIAGYHNIEKEYEITEYIGDTKQRTTVTCITFFILCAVHLYFTLRGTNSDFP